LTHKSVALSALVDAFDFPAAVLVIHIACTRKQCHRSPKPRSILAGSSNSHITTLVERKSRYTILVHVAGKDTESVVGAFSTNCMASGPPTTDLKPEELTSCLN
jgi:hypothetical protein